MESKLFYVTGNESKYRNACEFMAPLGIELEHHPLTLAELQSEDPVEVATAKAMAAWDILQEPLFVNDASWRIPSLGGFPGPFMKYVNRWFQPHDFLNLMRDKEDRRIILKDIIVYVDRSGCTVFSNEQEGRVLTEKTSVEYRYPSDAVVSFSRDGTSVAEELSRGAAFFDGEQHVWREFTDWLKAR